VGDEDGARRVERAERKERARRAERAKTAKRKIARCLFVDIC